MINTEKYDALYRESIQNPEGFWAEQGKRIDWITPYTDIKDCSFKKEDLHIRWYADGTLNACVNCLDRHLDERGDKTAFIWEGDDEAEKRFVTYRELHAEVCQFSNVLKSKGVLKGDRVVIYMPLVLEAVVAMLACARIGAVHSVVFGGFSPKSLRERINDCGAKVVITANEALRAQKIIPLKGNVDQALEECSSVTDCIVVRRTSSEVSWIPNRDCWYDEVMTGMSSDCPPEEMNAEDPLFILYTSGSTGKPKGVLHTTGGYMVYAAMTHHCVFDVQSDDIYWCTADVGWITGHTYVVYGPLANSVSSVIFEGVPTCPTPSRWWEIIDRYQVTTFYTAPTAIRSLMKEGDAWPQKAELSSLRLLGTVGEPINVEAWEWYSKEIGHDNCQIMDTWWQTETGGVMISAQPGMVPSKPGSASKPFYGVDPILMDNEGHVLEGSANGALCLADSWPGQARTLYNNHTRFVETYFSTYPGYYFTGDGCRRDDEGFYWITGRIDDVLNVSGHRLGTAEIEDALDSHKAVVESAVVGFPHDIKGQGIYAYLTLANSNQPSEELKRQLVQHVRHIIGPIATIDHIQWALEGLPKTRSGKIMRRILRKIAANEADQLGDTSTLADPSVVQHLIEGALYQKSA